MWKNWNLGALCVGMLNDAATMGSRMVIPQKKKIKNRITI